MNIEEKEINIKKATYGELEEAICDLSRKYITYKGVNYATKYI